MDNKDTEFDLRKKRILEISDRILDKVDIALGEVDRTIIKTKIKEKTVEYDSESKKVISEKQSEKENAEIIDSVIDTSALKQIVATLKDVKDIHSGLMQTEKAEEDGDNSGIIIISDILNKKDEICKI